MATTIVTKYGSGAPADTDIVRGELAVDTENGRLYTENAAGAVVEIGLNPSGNVDITGTATATKLVSANGVLELDDNGSHNGIINSPASLVINIDSDDSSTGEEFVIAKDRTSTTGGTELFRVQEDGNVGIGTTSPAYKTQISDSGDTVLSVTSGDSSSASLYLGDSVATRGRLTYNNANDSLAVYTDNNERMRIDSSGNVGIGISPSNTFSVGASGTVTTRYTSTDTAAFSLLQFENNGSIVFSADHGNAGANSAIIFKRDGAQESMRIDSVGKIVIGNNIPMWSGSYGGALFLKGNNATGDRYAQLAIVDSTGAIVHQGLILDTNGNLLVGTTVSSGDTANGKPVVAGNFTTKYGVTSIASTNTWTTVHTFGANQGNFMVSMRASGTGNTADNSVSLVAISDTVTTSTNLLAGSRVQIRIVGLTLQVLQTVFAGANINWSIMSIGN